MGVESANSLYSLLSSTAPLYNSGALSLILFGVKTIAEIPSLYRYIKKSKDWYGAAKMLLTRPIRYITPVLGPMLEAGAFERMVRNRIISETRAEFIKKFGEYQSNEDYVKGKMKMPLSEAIYLPEKMKKAA
jgi:ABC-type dipeptide/oligopeptide/nickel transport system permease component